MVQIIYTYMMNERLISIKYEYVIVLGIFDVAHRECECKNFFRGIRGESDPVYRDNGRVYRDNDIKLVKIEEAR